MTRIKFFVATPIAIAAVFIAALSPRVGVDGLSPIACAWAQDGDCDSPPADGPRPPDSCSTQGAFRTGANGSFTSFTAFGGNAQCRGECPKGQGSCTPINDSYPSICRCSEADG